MPRPLTGPFNLFGRWINASCVLYKIESVSTLARTAGISDNTLTENMKEGKPGPTRNTIDQLWQSFEALTEDSPLRESFPVTKDLFYNIADYGTPEQKEYARLHLIALEYFAAREEYIQALEDENKRLKEEYARLVESRGRPRK